MFHLQWAESRDSGRELFLDHDHVPFATLLSYMRLGKIKIEDITTDVLLLAEYLSMERLLAAIKARWFINIGNGEVPPSDSDDYEESIVSLFDKEHGGISDAIASGLFPLFLKSEAAEEMDVAVIRVRTDVDVDPPITVEIIHEFVSGHRHEVEGVDACSIIGAINGLYSMGYTFIEGQGHISDWIDGIKELAERDNNVRLWFPSQHNMFRMSYTMFRRKWSIPPGGELGKIFILPEGEAKVQSFTKQFAFAFSDHYRGPRIIAPTEFGDDNFHPFRTVDIHHTDANDSWLEKHKFWKREAWLEKHDVLKELTEHIREQSIIDQGTERCNYGTAIWRVYSREVRTAKLQSEG